MNTPENNIASVSSLERSVEMSLLLDFYGEMLSDKQREAMNLYYNEDLSLSEIAAITSLTRPGVRDRLVKSGEILKNLEDKLHLAARFREIRDMTDALVDKLEGISDSLNGDPRLLSAIADAKKISDSI